MKDFLHEVQNNNSKLAQLYFKVNPIRNSIAHALLEQGRRVTSDLDAINNAKSYQQEARKIFKTKTLDY
ncbi:MAG: hypothetical protein V7K94_19115 [Nostoc sp.]|uniref:hypothetical protein n=1 Tax=Nostoc sp. TaxID=1180 RepID=UPI002FF80D1D